MLIAQSFIMRRFFSNIPHDFITPFGTVLGSYQGVAGFSNGNDHYYSRQQHFLNENYTGIKYQCVEYVRRWLQHSKDLTFHNVPHAADIWKLEYFESLSNKFLHPVHSISNGSKSPPVIDSLLVWRRNESTPYGHVAIITHVDLQKNIIRVAEQNISNNFWPGEFSRELTLEVSNGEYRVNDKDPPLGWIVIAAQAESTNKMEKTFTRVIQKLPEHYSGFIDMSIPAEAYFAQRKDIALTNKSSKTVGYYLFEEHFARKIKLATFELNSMCLSATDFVVNNNELLHRFGLPEWCWPRIKSSWKTWKTHKFSLFGRFDLAANSKTLSCLSLNADSSGI